MQDTLTATFAIGDVQFQATFEPTAAKFAATAARTFIETLGTHTPAAPPSSGATIPDRKPSAPEKMEYLIPLRENTGAMANAIRELADRTQFLSEREQTKLAEIVRREVIAVLAECLQALPDNFVRMVSEAAVREEPPSP